MKQCSYCGKDYSDETVVCAIDGQALRDVVPPLPAPALPRVDDKRRIIDAEHLKLLSIFHFVVAGLAFVGILFLLFHYLVMSTMLTSPDFWKSQNNAPTMPKDFFKIFIWFYFVMGTVLVTAGILNLLSAIFLLRAKHRTFSLVIGGLNCLQIPFGTVLGIFTILVLSRDSVWQKYAA
jgi:hypothetical protein